ncbi:MAG: glycosyltransferase [Planctomycetes bacterium]|nr:glycosyltransferase [Planctomycetota bacterium]
MRICLVVHGFPPVERTGVEQYTLGLCRALARAGHRVEVFVPRKDPQLADLALRREEHGGYAINWITNNQDPTSPREALLVPQLRNAFAAFLERERPEVVHFHHLIKLGLELVEVARERGLPTVYTAHDYYPVCHRYTLLRPDLSRCDVRGDSRACARCDLALSHLNAQPALGDYHSGALRAQLSAEAWSGLQAILADRASEAGFTPEAVQEASEQRADLDRLRAAAYRGFDLVLAPSRFLIDELVRGGFARERIEYAPYGFDNADLAALPPPRREPGRAPRFAFLGGVAKHKGVHVLLDACAQLAGRAEVSVWGGSSDKRYVELVRQRCGEVGAQWRGPYERAELPEILATVDALVVPSIWVENYPLVIHEALAAGRPVLASRVGALPESVQDGVNGLLFAPGDADDLARALRRCCDEPELLEQLARGITPGRTMELEAHELAARYAALRARRAAPPAATTLPPSLVSILARYEEFSALPARELFVRVLSGLDDLREEWAGELGPVEAVDLLAIGLGEGSEAQDRLREARNEIAWLRTKKEELDEGREELMTLFEDLDKLLNDTRTGSKRQAEHLESAGTYVRQKEGEVSEAHARLRELEAVIADKNRHIGQVEGHLQDAGRYIRHKEQEYRDVESELHKAAEFARTKEEELRAVRAAGEAGQQKERSLELSARSASQVGLLAVQAQERLLNESLRPILSSLHRIFAPQTELLLPKQGTPFVDLLGALAQVRNALEVLEKEVSWRRQLADELNWRRGRMEKMRMLVNFWLWRLPLALSPLGREVKKWDAPPNREPQP